MTVAAELERWEADLEDETVIRPSEVQNRLLALHDLVEGPARQRVERWLSGSTARTLYRRDEVDDMIATLRADPLPTPN